MGHSAAVWFGLGKGFFDILNRSSVVPVVTSCHVNGNSRK